MIPTLNEVENVDAVTARVLEETGEFEVEILIVDDNSKDGTQEKVLGLGKTRPVHLLERKQPTHGLAGAVLAGAREAKQGVVVIMDADLSHPPERVRDLVRPVLSGEADMVIGSRYAPGGSTPGWPWVRRAMSRSASALAWPLTDVNDALSGFFALRRELLTSIPSDAAGFKIALEVLVRGGDDLRVQEVPITFRDRTYGQSKMGSKVVFTYMRRLLALSGWRESTDTPAAAFAKSLLVALTDFGAFIGLLSLGKLPANAHVASFGIAMLANFVFKFRQRERAERTDAKFVGRFVVVSALALMLRDVTFAVCFGSGRLPATAAIVPAIFSSYVLGYLGYALFIWPKREQYGAGIRWRVGALCLLAFSVVYRLLAIASVGAAWKAPVVPNGVLRYGAFGCWAASAVFLYGFARTLYGKSTAFKSVMLLGVLPYFFFTGIFATREAPLLACWSAALFFLVRAARGGRAVSWLGVGVGLGLGALVDLRILAAAIAVAALALIDGKLRRTLKTVWPYAGAILAAVLALGLHRAFGLGHRPVTVHNPAGLWKFLLAPLLLLSPVGACAAVLGLFKRSIPERTDSKQFVAWAIGVPILVLAAVSTVLIHPWRLGGPIWWCALPLVAAGIGRRASQESGQDLLTRSWPLTIVLLLLLYGVLIHYWSFVHVAPLIARGFLS